MQIFCSSLLPKKLAFKAWDSLVPLQGIKARCVHSIAMRRQRAWLLECCTTHCFIAQVGGSTLGLHCCWKERGRLTWHLCAGVACAGSPAAGADPAAAAPAERRATPAGNRGGCTAAGRDPSSHQLATGSAAGPRAQPLRRHLPEQDAHCLPYGPHRPQCQCLRAGAQASGPAHARDRPVRIHTISAVFVAHKSNACHVSLLAANSKVFIYPTHAEVGEQYWAQECIMCCAGRQLRPGRCWQG
jgi:hypothetical protein